MIKLVLLEGDYLGFCIIKGYIYKLNASYYAYRSGKLSKLKEDFKNESII